VTMAPEQSRVPCYSLLTLSPALYDAYRSVRATTLFRDCYGKTPGH